MSRTDKDRPYHVRAADPLEPGRYESHWHDFHTRLYSWGRRADADYCDLHENVYARNWRDRGWCTYQIEGWAYAPYRHSKREDRRLYGHKPSRARAHRNLEQIRKEANAGSRDDWDVFSPQARHSVDWLVS